MFGLTRWNPFDELLSLQREADRLFNQFGDLPTTPRTGNWSNLRVTAGDESWTMEVPLPGIDPQHITLEAAAATHRHGLLVLTLPVRESVRPRRIEIDSVPVEQKRITAAA